jgi:hypothetical protein
MNVSEESAIDDASHQGLVTGSTQRRAPVDVETLAAAESLLADRRAGLWYTDHHAELKTAVFALARERHAVERSGPEHSTADEEKRT